jgi:hypothetical protein
MHGRWRALAAAIAVVAGGAAACMGSVDRVYDDGGNDAASDTAPAPDVASGGADGAGGADASIDVPDDGPNDASAPETAPQEASVAPDAPPDVVTGQVYSCNGQPVTSCAACGNNTVECIFCAADGGHPGVCGAKGQYCQTSQPPNASVCNCPGTTGAASCPAPFQVCSTIGFPPTNYCQACGELGSGNEACKGGGTCNQQLGTCN